MLEILTGLCDPQVTQLLGRMATPPEFTQIAACDFDKSVVHTSGATCHVVLSDMQRTEVGSALRKGVGIAHDC